MSYADLTFSLFLALVLAGVVLLPAKARPLWLILANLWFYAAPDPQRLLWLGGVVAVAFAALSRPTLRKPTIAALIALLVWAKFPDALGLPDPHPPPGLSFYTFTAIGLSAFVGVTSRATSTGRICRPPSPSSGRPAGTSLWANGSAISSSSRSAAAAGAGLGRT